MIALVAIAVSAVGWLSYRNLEQALLQRARDRIETHSRQVATDLEYYAASATGDVAGFRSAVALHGLIRARKAGGIDPIDGVSEKTWRDRIASRFAAELEAKPSYAMFRIIGVDDEAASWSASTATDRTARFGSSRKRACRSEAIATTSRKRSGSVPRQIYVSPLDLGRLNGQIEEVHRPTIRVATPIFASDGKPFGIFMINVDMRRAFDRVRSSVWPGESDLCRQPVRRLSHSSGSFARIRRAARQAQRLEGRLPASGGAGWEQRKAAPTSFRTRPPGPTASLSRLPFWPGPNGSASSKQPRTP